MRPENNGGCVSIFFHLFSKKKQPKLLPSPLNRVVCTEEKVSSSNLVVIADENHEECVKPELESDLDLDNTMQAAGVVARLMGLETMPVVLIEKPKKALDLKFCSDSEHLMVDDGSKLEKMGKSGGFLEHRPVNGFRKGLGFYGSRKKQCMKLESPVKSPRMVVGSNVSRLVQVANKILDPGLQTRGRAKFAISYRVGLEGERDGGRDNLSDSLSGSCNSFKSSVRVKNNLVAECVSSASDVSNGSDKRKKMESRSKVKGEEVHKMKVSVAQSRQLNNRSVAIQANVNVENRTHDVMAMKESSGNIGDQCETSALRKNNLRKQTEKNHNTSVRVKNFIALNKNLNNYARSRSPTKVSGSSRVESERDGRENNVSKKTSLVNRNLEVFDNSFYKGRRSSDVISRKEARFLSNHSLNKSCRKGNSQPVNCDSFNKSDKNGVVSFTFNSPMTQRRRKGEGGHNHAACHSKKLISDEKTESLSSDKGITLRGDELGNLLEEKIRELSSFNQSGDVIQGRSTVSILEELISALRIGAPDMHKRESCSDASFQTEISVYPNHTINTDEDCQENAQPGICTAYSVDVSDQPSPISILEASFSNDTCSLESLNEYSESIPQFGLPEDCNNTQSSYQDFDISDSATSLDICHLTEGGISGSDVGPTTETVSDAELLFENLSLYGSDGTVKSLDSFLLDTLENIIDVLSVNFNLATERNQLREFLYDCIMECLDFKFSHFCRSGFRTWLKLPLILNRDRLMSEVHVEIRRWESLTGKTLDDLVEKELNWSNPNWTVCETEAFEAGVEIQSYILQMLIEELVNDLC